MAHPETDSLAEANLKAIEKAVKAQNMTSKVFRVFEFPLVDKNPIKAKAFPAEFTGPSDYISQADYIVTIGPMWNFGYPGMYKNFLDGVTQSHKFFRFVPHAEMKKLVTTFPFLKHVCPTAMPKGLLKAKKVLMVWTADGPEWYYRVLWWKNNIARVTKAVFSYCGVTRFDQRILGTTRLRSDEERVKWLEALEGYKF